MFSRDKPVLFFENLSKDWNWMLKKTVRMWASLHIHTQRTMYMHIGRPLKQLILSYWDALTYVNVFVFSFGIIMQTLCREMLHSYTWFPMAPNSTSLVPTHYIPHAVSYSLIASICIKSIILRLHSALVLIHFVHPLWSLHQTHCKTVASMSIKFLGEDSLLCTKSQSH